MITSTAERNTAQAGGAFAVATSGTYLSNAAGPVLTVSTTSTSENRATDDGGALHALDARTLVFLGSSLRNVAGRHGGAAFSTTTRTDANVELRLYGTRMEANEVRPRGLLSRSMPCLQLPSCPQSQRLQDMNGCERAPPPLPLPALKASGNGGAITVLEARGEVSLSTLVENKASGSGGAVYVASSKTQETPTLVVGSSTIRRNKVSVCGGGAAGRRGASAFASACLQNGKAPT